MRKNNRTDQEKEQTLQEYREAIREARNALDEMEKEIEKELCPENPDKSENNNQAVSVRARP